MCLFVAVPFWCQQTIFFRQCLEVEQIAARAHTCRFLNGMHVPAYLPAVLGCALGIFHIGFEIHNSPGPVFEKGQVDYGVKQASDIILDQNRQFAMATARPACSFEQRMLQRRSDGFRGCLDFFVCGIQ